MDITVDVVGVALPATVYGCTHSAVRAVVGHGLGSRDPSRRSHSNDEWVSLLLRTLLDFGASAIAYTARGHGRSAGWEISAAASPEQFTWQGALSDDMLAVGRHYAEGASVIYCGSSMGSATSFYAAYKDPQSCSGLIIVRPPTAWAEREARRKNLVSSARRLAEQEDAQGGGKKYQFVLQGAALSDLPRIDDLPAYGLKMKDIPQLILCVEGDDAHPVSTAITLKQHFPGASLYIAGSEEEAKIQFPVQIMSFLLKIGHRRA